MSLLLDGLRRRPPLGGGGTPVLIRLLRSYLRPYRRPLLAVVVLQLVGTIASLYLPSLNADIIDNGRRHAATPATSCASAR